MDKFDDTEVCPACGNDPIESGLKWKPKFNAGVKKKDMDALLAVERFVGVAVGGRLPEINYLDVSCGQCKYQMKRGCLNV